MKINSIKTIKFLTATILLLGIFSCKDQGDYYTSSTIITQQPPVRQEISINSSDSNKGMTHSQFESRDLETAKELEKKLKVALFLPLSGKNKALGEHIVNSALLSLFDNDKKHNLQLVLIDSKDSEAEALEAFQEIIKQEIKIVIGPVFSNSTNAIKDLAKENKITVISLSNNHKLLGNANKDGGVFLAGLMVESQIDQMVGYVMRQGRNNFAVIAPNNHYGFAVTQILKDTVVNRNANFTASEIYEYNLKDLDKSIERLVNSFTIPSHLAQGGGNKIDKETIITEEDRQYVQAILVPESGKVLSKIANLVKEKNNGQRDIKLIGTSQWDELSTLNNDNLVDAWFVSPKADEFRDFERDYYKKYEKFPPRIASISYDLIDLIANLAKENDNNVNFYSFVSGNLIKEGFKGIDGLFRFLPNGYVQRNLAILKVGNGEFEVAEDPVKIFLQY